MSGLMITMTIIMNVNITKKIIIIITTRVDSKDVVHSLAVTVDVLTNNLRSRQLRHLHLNAWLLDSQLLLGSFNISLTIGHS